MVANLYKHMELCSSPMMKQLNLTWPDFLYNDVLVFCITCLSNRTFNAWLTNHALAISRELDATLKEANTSKMLTAFCDVLIDLDADHRIEGCLDRFASFLATSDKESLKGSYFATFLAEDDRKRFEGLLASDRHCSPDPEESMHTPVASIHVGIVDSLGRCATVRLYYVPRSSLGGHSLGICEIGQRQIPQAPQIDQLPMLPSICTGEAKGQSSSQSRSSSQTQEAVTWMSMDIDPFAEGFPILQSTTCYAAAGPEFLDLLAVSRHADFEEWVQDSVNVLSAGSTPLEPVEAELNLRGISGPVIATADFEICGLLDGSGGGGASSTTVHKKCTYRVHLTGLRRKSEKKRSEGSRGKHEMASLRETGSSSSCDDRSSDS